MASAAPDLHEIRAAAERAIRAAMSGTLTFDEAVASVLAAAEERRVAITPSEQVTAEAARLLELWRKAGADRDAAAKVARSLTGCPQQREILAQRIRRIVRRHRNETSTARLPARASGIVAA